MKNSKKIPKYFILDVDGVITNGQMIYDKVGKKFKTFGPDDTDALKVLQQFIKIHFVSGDKKGFSISKKRVTDMGFKISFVPALQRDKWINKKYGLKNCIYMGDGIFDHLVMKNANYSVTLKNSLEHVLNSADYVTKRNSGDRAVAETVIHILKVFFKINFANIKKFKIKLN
jgi:3-deoxy-D-manno-octulosonate 8-phosphate phosphatase (KDO 8-P phosphatase)